MATRHLHGLGPPPPFPASPVPRLACDPESLRWFRMQVVREPISIMGRFSCLVSREAAPDLWGIEADDVLEVSVEVEGERGERRQGGG